jgi:Uma2 family endonuclease
MKTLELEEPVILSQLEDMTEDDFVDWYDEDVKAEFIDGEVIVHSPVSIHHDSIGMFLGSLLMIFVEKNNAGKLCGTSRIQARLRPSLRREPDLMFIAKDRLSIIRKNHIEGAPDLAVEIVSPDSLTRDWREKYYEYEQAGVKEYWVIDPDAKRMDMYFLDEQENYELIPLEKGKLHSRIFPDFWVKPEWFWQEELPNVLDVAKELNLI